MKTKKIIFLEKILRVMAVAVLKRHKPKIVAITGSVGKTSTKAAVFSVLSSKFDVRENQKNYNNEIGIPLTIIGAQSGGRNIFKWLWVFLKWILTIVYSKYPEILVLELGVDRPGDMKYLTSFLKPMVSVVTNISLSHIEFFKTVENIAKEKRVLVEAVPQDGFVILNADDEFAVKMSEYTLAQPVTFGLAENAQINASNVIYNYQNEKPEGISFKLNYDGKNVPIRLKNILAAHYVYAALVGIASGIIFKLNLVEIAKALEDFHAPCGRMNLIKGLHGSFIVDDTYNASPMSTLAALDVLGDLKGTRKMAVLGDMLELGDLSQASHREIGHKIFKLKLDIFIAVGTRMKAAVAELIALGYPAGNIFQFDDSESAGKKIKELLNEGDFVLVKGSQGMRMEKVVEQIMENSSELENTLCRQSKDWRKKPFVKP
ncbi:MAG: UDP-N-acetylmuramoyl-tripeptide-D-alanyl-D-alanine ligase [Candidatus Moranbacteria bacterium GW2011_GWE1_36_7]|nr:MAG: UDP-N-acetylmuramoyl-tripeptide-D-alanyl-D-alanine ligase [Candidatus Moranbacteria bacterium GW2011_GWD2_36_12]KKQ05969.1 MAG: UDP-N-acetylmuramoyl-tripeptide-D-alanyl-D-alanine ligase [Candidatus Moranbacteria bacterium GW2011_GWE2_36_40]KKQ11847.1 MAG: UDP-N-acetylmuramoyl-tripeptide-D-alanyl-D-alanine ligase [Candidatus Moranbacteria bacterium GW2011_GWE1_36_7]